MIDSLIEQGIDVRRACQTLGVSSAGYYASKKRPVSPRALRHVWLSNEISDIHRESGGTYGALRVTAELKHGRGIAVGHRAVEMLMKRLGLQGLPRKKAPKGAKLGEFASLDLVRRDFYVGAPDRLWMTDITEHPTREGKVFCCAVLDAFSRKIVGWSIDSSQTTALVTNALGMAVGERNPGVGSKITATAELNLRLGRSATRSRAQASSRRWAC